MRRQAKYPSHKAKRATLRRVSFFYNGISIANNPGPVKRREIKIIFIKDISIIFSMDIGPDFFSVKYSKPKITSPTKTTA